MKNIFYILKRDIKRLLSSWAAVVVVIGICLLPSLYAWFNVAANMTPYANTSGIRVAVAIADKGASPDPDIGVEDRNSAGNDAEAFGSSGKTETINAGDKIKENLKKNNMLKWVFTDEDDALERVKSGDCYAAYIIPEDFTEDLLSFTKGKTVTPEIRYYINEKLNPIAPKVTDTAASVMRTSINGMFREIVFGKMLEAASDTAKTIHNDITEGKTNLISDIESTRQLLKEYRRTMSKYDSLHNSGSTAIRNSRKLTNSIDTNLRQIEKTLNSNDKLLGDLEKNISDSEALINEHRDLLGEKLSQTMINRLEIINGRIHLAQNANSKSLSLVFLIKPETELLHSMLTDMQEGLDATKRSLDSANAAALAADSLLLDAQRALGSLESVGAFEQLENLSPEDKKSFSEYITAPVSIKTEKQFPVKNYGSGLAPFYTMLALWVSGLILVAIFKLEVDPETDDGRKLTLKEKYFGRALLMTILGLIQALIIAGGNIWLLGIQCLHPAAFIGASLIASIVFVNLIYALAVTFRHVGKAIAVIMIILMIPGSSGTYPIETTGAFFRTIEPFLPFTYGIKALREAVAGFYGNTYLFSLLHLLVFMGLALFIGLGLRSWMSNLNSTFDRRLRDTGFLAADENAGTGEISAVKKAVKILYSNESSKYKLEEIADRFEEKHSALEDKGLYFVFLPVIILFVLTCILPWKLVMLCLWILSVIATVVWLIVMEHTHMVIQDRRYFREVTRNEKHNSDI